MGIHAAPTTAIARIVLRLDDVAYSPLGEHSIAVRIRGRWLARPAGRSRNRRTRTATQSRLESTHQELGDELQTLRGALESERTQREQLAETFGARQTHWVSATIDPRDPNLFEFAPRIVAGNVG